MGLCIDLALTYTYTYTAHTLRIIFKEAFVFVLSCFTARTLESQFVCGGVTFKGGFQEDKEETG